MRVPLAHTLIMLNALTIKVYKHNDLKLFYLFICCYIFRPSHSIHVTVDLLLWSKRMKEEKKRDENVKQNRTEPHRVNAIARQILFFSYKISERCELWIFCTQGVVRSKLLWKIIQNKFWILSVFILVDRPLSVRLLHFTWNWFQLHDTYHSGWVVGKEARGEKKMTLGSMISSFRNSLPCAPWCIYRYVFDTVFYTYPIKLNGV